ncbi:MAG: hypothetical protein IJM30_12195 [Thermoguttaceae bacterium]|nr:hypothetical protein [Thermoguttaceae bacterium]
MGLAGGSRLHHSPLLIAGGRLATPSEANLKGKGALAAPLALVGETVGGASDIWSAAARRRREEEFNPKFYVCSFTPLFLAL